MMRFLIGVTGLLVLLIAGCDRRSEVEALLGIQTVYEYYEPPTERQPARHLFVYPTGEAKLYIGVDSVTVPLSPEILDTLARAIRQVHRWNQEFLVAGDFAVATITRIKPDGIETLRKATNAADVPPEVHHLFLTFRWLSEHVRYQMLQK